MAIKDCPKCDMYRELYKAQLVTIAKRDAMIVTLQRKADAFDRQKHGHRTQLLLWRTLSDLIPCTYFAKRWVRAVQNLVVAE